MKILLNAIALITTLACGQALADCTRGDRTYGEGQTVGPYTCEEGKWVRK